MPPHALSLAQRLQDIANANTTANSEDIGKLVRDIIESLQQGSNKTEQSLRQEMLEIVSIISQARQDVASIGTHAIVEANLPVATDELEAVVKATEEATGKFLDAAEKIGAVAAELGDTPVAETLNDVATMIYEASNFQDVTGQRLTKVIKSLQKIEAKIVGLVGQNGATQTTENKANINDPQSLLNGPQLPDNASSQDDIDALFDSL